MKHATDEEVVRQKMKQTFVYRQRMVHTDQSPDVLSTFSRFADVKGLVSKIHNGHWFPSLICVVTSYVTLIIH